MIGIIKSSSDPFIKKVSFQFCFVKTFVSNNTPTKQTNVMDMFLTPLGLKHTGKGQKVRAIHTSNRPYMAQYIHLRLIF